MTDELLIEQVVSAHRERSLDGAVKSHPAWHDLDEAGRERAFAAALEQRALEAALAKDGVTTTVAAVLRRITQGR